jgi:hypothetical protein
MGNPLIKSLLFLQIIIKKKIDTFATGEFSVKKLGLDFEILPSLEVEVDVELLDDFEIEFMFRFFI